MASRSIQSGTFEPMDKLSLSTLKRHPKMDLNKTDLLRLLSYLEGELQARDISIAALKTEKAKQLLYQAKYGRFGLGDPFNALQRDSDCQKDNSFDETAVKAMYDNQLAQLENLIDTQRKAQQRMREQLASVEKRYHKVLSELEDEKRKHAQDTAQGDDVTYMLEKDRQRLKQEVDFEKAQVKKAEKEVKKLTGSLDEERASSDKHKAVALMLIKERRRMLERLLQLEQVRVHAKQLLQEERVKTHTEAEGRIDVEQLEQRCAQVEVKRMQAESALAQEEKKNASMSTEVSRLEKLVETLQRQVATATATPNVKASVHTTPNCISSMPPGVKEMAASQISRVLSPVLGRATGVGAGALPLTPRKGATPVSVTQSRMFQTPSAVSKQPVGGSAVKLPINKGVVGVSSAVRHTVAPSSGIKMSTERPVPAEKPAELSTQRVNVISSGGTTVLSSQPGSPTVFTTPSGTRISLNVSPSPGTTRRASGTGRGVPPPVPPNKPLVYIPTSPVPRPTVPFQHPGGTAQNISPGSGASPRPQTPPKFGITILKDQVTLASSSGATVGSLRPKNSSSQRFVSSTAPSTNSSSVRPAPAAGSDSLVIRKPSQSSSQCDVSTPGGDTVVPVATNVDNFRQPELSPDFPVSVATTGASEGNASCVASSTSSSPSSSSLHPPDVFIFPLHKYASEGDVNTLVAHLHTNGISNVNWPTPDGSTAVHLATVAGNTDCLRVLLENGGDSNAVRNDQSTPVHLAASVGHLSCLRLLLLHGGKVDTTDQSGWTPLHFSSMNGHLDCCRYLLENAARLDVVTTSRWTPLHCVVHSGHVHCLQTILSTSTDQYSLQSHRSLSDIINMPDNDGWTAVHLAAIRDNADCLQLLAGHCNFEPTTVLGVASPQCRTFLDSLSEVPDEMCSVYIELPPNTHLETSQCIGQVSVTTETTWSELEERLSSEVMNHISAVSTGMRTKRTSWLEQDLPSPSTYSLGLTLDSVRSFCIGQHTWSPGTPAVQCPHEVLSNYHTQSITVQLFGLKDGCLDALSYESLIPVSLLQTYLRLMEQHKNLVFVGPGGIGKTYLARKLAESIQAKQEQCGNTANIHFIPVSESFTRMDLISLLIETGCLLPTSQPVSRGHSPILVFDDLGKVNVNEVFKDILPAIESRGLNNLLHISLGGALKSCNLTGHCYIVGSIDRSRFVSLGPGVQQQFHWVHFRNDQEPIRGLLQRHLYRRLVHTHGGLAPPSDNPVFRAVEWVLCVWLRLNEGVHKLGLADSVKVGPTHLMSCPIEANNPQAVLRWLCQLWNHTVVPAVTCSVVLGSSGATVETVLEEHRLVASRAVYVLTQKAVVSGCPLTDQEKESYLASFQGSSEPTIRISHDNYTHPGGKQQPGIADTIYVTRTVTTDEEHTAPCGTDNRDALLSEKRPGVATMTTVATPPTSVHLKPPSENAARSVITPPSGSDSVKTVSFSSTVPSYGNVVFALSGIPASRTGASPVGHAVASPTVHGVASPMGHAVSPSRPTAAVTTAHSDLVVLPGTLFRVTQTSSLQGVGADRLFLAGNKLQHLPNFTGSFEREVVTERQLAIQLDRSRLPSGQGGPSRRERRSCSPEIMSPSRQSYYHRDVSVLTSGQAGRLRRSCSPEIMSYDRQAGDGSEARESPPKLHKDNIPW